MISEDMRHCERVTRTHARTFTLASYFLPAHKRRAAFALYAFCRVADDLVDRVASARDDIVELQLADYRRMLDDALGGRPEGPVFRELAWAVETFAVPPHVLNELLAGVARDLHPASYESWTELGQYCEGVASTVGEMCTFVFGVRDGVLANECALRYARTLGVAMQLTNILRDVGEDARSGRCYLPREELACFGLSTSDVINDPSIGRGPRWRGFMRFQVARARMLYVSARPGISLLAPDAQRCAAACATGYAAILDAIEAIGYDTVSSRARVSHWSRAGIMLGVCRPRGHTRIPPGDGPAVSWHHGPIDVPMPGHNA